MRDQMYQLLKVRVVVTVILIVATMVLYIMQIQDAATAMMTLTTTAVTWLFKTEDDE